ncbi:DUF3833 family protein [Sagittula sp. NFXS13]|uniref:DUF3833 domain-containing protein n=1 Tax=Sagittula sp. NFXS13 TaxID=2819095 RepID=UPI0032DF5124
MIWALAGAAIVALTVLARRRLADFPAQHLGDYRDEPGEALDLRRHLSGPIEAHGVIYGPTGRVVSRFAADFVGTWQGNTGVLKEHYRYASGREEAREWRLILGNDATVTGEADDVIGKARGQLAGPALRLRYRLQLPDDAGGHVLSATDWMYLAPDGAVVNRSQFRKFGIKVAELVAVMRPKEKT